MNTLLLLCLLSVFPAMAPGSCSWTGVGRTVAIGDVHGDFRGMVGVLRHAGLIDSSKNWCGGKTHLVQTGDILDRGPDSRMAMDLLMRLEEQAPLQGGMVHCLIGNHEAMNLTGDFRYVHPGEADSHGGMKNLAINMRPTGRYGWWIAGHSVAVRINDTVFVHAGISDEYSGFSLFRLNTEVQKRLRWLHRESQVLGGQGPLWYRGWALDPSSSVERSLGEFLGEAGADFAVIGHSVTDSGVETRFRGRVVMIDTGLSECYGGPGEYLVLDQNGYKAVNPGDGAAW